MISPRHRRSRPISLAGEIECIPVIVVRGDKMKVWADCNWCQVCQVWCSPCSRRAGRQSNYNAAIVSSREECHVRWLKKRLHFSNIE